MTRREFRGSVAAPRPASAWLMSLVASATLWITEQIPLWVIGIQIVTFAASFLTRHAPPSFRTSPIWLNVFMAGVTTVTIRSALDGNPATISLAYFTALAQGLQLLDARPRKSEFVLVALSLFQVILASNLTDSVFFPPLLVIFLATVTWTLLVHTLSMEAAEAGDGTSLAQVLAPDLRRLTFLATGACLLLAVVLFVLLPRLKTNMLQGGMNRGVAMVGFSDRVQLGDVGRIRSDSTVVLRVEALEGELPAPQQTYFRGLAFDAFDGRHWSISHNEREAARNAISGIGRFGIQLRPKSPEAGSTLRIVREPVAADVIFTQGEVERIAGPFQRLESDRNGGLYLPGRGDERIRYTTWSHPSERDATKLAGDRAVPPLEPGPGGRRPALRYLQLPELDPAVARHARQIVGDAANDFERAFRLQQNLRQNGRYTDSPPALGDATTSPIEDFVLGELEGHCEYFASAMVVLARSQGLPSRLVNGFAGGVPNGLGGFLEMTRADAHAWVEVHFEQAGWVRFDPTPPGMRLRAEEDLSLWAQMGQLGSAIELWWFQRVVDFDSADQIGVLRALWLAWKQDRTGDSTDPAAGMADAQDPTPDPFWSNPLQHIDPRVAIACAALLWLAWRIARHARSRNDLGIPEAYQRAQRILARRGWVRSETTSARDFAAQIDRALPGPGASAFSAITAQYLAERFGSAESIDLEDALARLEHAVDRMGLGNQSHVR